MNDMVEPAGIAGGTRSYGDLVRLSGVHKYHGGDGGGGHGKGLAGGRALQGVDLELGRGEIVAVCGPSGSGKTSLLNIIGMLEPPTEGSVVVASLLTGKLSEQARSDLRNDIIGFVFQAFTLIPVMTVRENVLLPLMLRGQLDAAQTGAAGARADELLGRLGLGTLAGQFPPRLDPSQAQRVAIARALIGKPRLVLADEPVTRQDSSATRAIMDLLAHEQHEHGTTVLITTRDQRQLSRVTRTLQLADGRLLNVPTDHSRKSLRVQL